ncbi:hypothetical protein ACFFS2_35870 [Streptomyces aurantiacus]|uniref:Lipoprotein n=1 Tax=Streptomyces aurantiacus TaxID=47760 RepID=A0A7G1P9V8_9ACTN|nr:hypothetical protein [Streptomyces aurantiacus]BCL32139.1 lipoprotein [Streptomyces aurantiacus]
MPRTATTAALLVTVAVLAASAVSGCVTVQRPPSSGPPPPPPPVSEPRPDGSAAPRVVQAPAREALERVGPSRRPSAPASAPARTHPKGPTSAPADPARRAPAGLPPRPEPRRPEHRDVPRLPAPAPAPPANPDVCALGQTYGGWQADSPQAAICEDAYGR